MPDERATFLAVLGRGGSVDAAAREAGRSRQRFYELRERDKDFEAEWLRATTPTMLVERPAEQSAPYNWETAGEYTAELDTDWFSDFRRNPGENTSDYMVRRQLWMRAEWDRILKENGGPPIELGPTAAIREANANRRWEEA